MILFSPIQPTLASWIVEPFDVVKDISSGLGTSLIHPPVYALAFEHPEEALHRSIVSAATDGTHALDKVMAPKEALVLAARELAATVRVQYHRGMILSLSQRH